MGLSKAEAIREWPLISSALRDSSEDDVFSVSSIIVMESEGDRGSLMEDVMQTMCRNVDSL